MSAITDALRASGGRVPAAARALGLSPKVMRELIARRPDVWPAGVRRVRGGGGGKGASGRWGNGRLRHGHATRESTTPEHRAWRGMKDRCLNPNGAFWSRYGGRGITVCDRWRTSFEAFLVDMGPRPSPKHSLDRINNDGNYEPGNCRWATRVEQMRNTCRALRIEHGGRVLNTAEWAEVTGIPAEAIQRRLAQGWTVERALTQPMRRRP